MNKVSVWAFCAGMFACTLGLYLIMVAVLNEPFQWGAVAAFAIKEAALALILTWKQ
jgi:hypothetical protein